MKSVDAAGIRSGRPAPEAGPGEAPAAQGEEALGHLVAGAGEVGEGVQPGFHPHPDVAEVAVGGQSPAGEQRQSRGRVGVAAGGGEEHGGEHHEDQQRGAQVALVDEHREAHPEGQQHREQLAGLGEAERAQAAGHGGQGPAPVGQVRGEEGDDQQLGRLSGLEGERQVARLEAHPQAGTVEGDPAYRPGPGQEGQQQQAQAGDQEQVAVAAEHADPAPAQEEESRRGERRPRPAATTAAGGRGGGRCGTPPPSRSP